MKLFIQSNNTLAAGNKSIGILMALMYGWKYFFMTNISNFMKNLTEIHVILLYLIISSRRASSRSCSAFSKKTHARSISLTSFPSGGTQCLCPFDFNLVWMLKKCTSMFPLSRYLKNNKMCDDFLNGEICGTKQGKMVFEAENYKSTFSQPISSLCPGVVGRAINWDSAINRGLRRRQRWQDESRNWELWPKK